MKRSTALVFFAALGLPGSAFAQFEACPGGVQVGQQCGGGVCQPICQYDPARAHSPNHGPKPPPIVIERWHVPEDRFTAFAQDNQLGPYGFVSGLEDQEAADAAAIAQCKERGGKDCVVQGQFKNLCATFAWGGGHGTVRGEKTVEGSRQRALEKCAEAAGVNCDVIETVCSEPVYRIVDEKPDDFVEDTSRRQ